MPPIYVLLCSGGLPELFYGVCKKDPHPSHWLNSLTRKLTIRALLSCSHCSGGLLELFYGVYEKDSDRCLDALVAMGVLVPGGDRCACACGGVGGGRLQGQLGTPRQAAACAFVGPWWLQLWATRVLLYHQHPRMHLTLACPQGGCAAHCGVLPQLLPAAAGGAEARAPAQQGEGLLMGWAGGRGLLRT